MTLIPYLEQPKLGDKKVSHQRNRTNYLNMFISVDILVLSRIQRKEFNCSITIGTRYRF